MKRRLLIVEDDRWLADIYRDVLHPRYEIVISHNAQSAMETLDDAPPGAVLLDIMLPGGNGFAFLQELRSYDDMSDVPVVVCSSVNLSPTQRQALLQFAPIDILDKSELSPKCLRKIVEESMHASPK